MGDKVEDLRQKPADEKDIDESTKAAPDAPAEAAATAPVLNESSASSGQEDDAGPSGGERRVATAQYHYQQDGVFWKALRFIFYIPLKVLSLFGLNLLQPNLRVSGNDKIDKSPLRPASTSPQKRKRSEVQEASSDEGEDEVAKLLDDDQDYDSQDDKDFKPGEESSCSEEYAEGDTEAELSKLSVEDVSEPRPSAMRNLTETDLEDKGKGTEEKPMPETEPPVIATKCVDDPISKPEITPATVGVMG